MDFVAQKKAAKHDVSILNAGGLFSTRLDLVLIGDVPKRRAYPSKPDGQTGSIRLTVPEVLDRKTVMIGANNLKAHCTAFSLQVKKKEEGTPDWAHEKGSMNAMLHNILVQTAVFWAFVLLNESPQTRCLRAGPGYDANLFGDTLNKKGIKTYILGAENFRTRLSNTKSAVRNGVTI